MVLSGFRVALVGIKFKVMKLDSWAFAPGESFLVLRTMHARFCRLSFRPLQLLRMTVVDRSHGGFELFSKPFSFKLLDSGTVICDLKLVNIPVIGKLMPLSLDPRSFTKYFLIADSEMKGEV